MTISLKSGLLYGPVHSRRLGRSLGINLLSAERKICTFDCLYCQYGWTPDRGAAPKSFADPAALQTALEEFLPNLAEPPDALTFSGNGEPTLHPRFQEIVDLVIGLRDRLAPSARTGVLSNSTTARRKEIRDAIRRLDMPIMKLDAGTDAVFREFNRPPAGVSLADVVDGLAELGGVTVQSLWAGGYSGNHSEEEVDAWVARLMRIRPRTVQVYTLDRGWPEPGLRPLEREKLDAIVKRVRAEGISAEAFWRV